MSWAAVQATEAISHVAGVQLELEQWKGEAERWQAHAASCEAAAERELGHHERHHRLQLCVGGRPPDSTDTPRSTDRGGCHTVAGRLIHPAELRRPVTPAWPGLTHT
jgi:hypothetical protein